MGHSEYSYVPLSSQTTRDDGIPDDVFKNISGMKITPVKSCT